MGVTMLLKSPRSEGRSSILSKKERLQTFLTGVVVDHLDLRSLFRKGLNPLLAASESPLLFWIDTRWEDRDQSLFLH